MHFFTRIQRKLLVVYWNSVKECWLPLNAEKNKESVALFQTIGTSGIVGGVAMSIVCFKRDDS